MAGNNPAEREREKKSKWKLGNSEPITNLGMFIDHSNLFCHNCMCIFVLYRQLRESFPEIQWSSYT